MKWLLIALTALTLAACETPNAVPVLTTERPVLEAPASLRAKCTIPNPPPQGSTQRALAIYILDMNEALENCAAKHSSLVAVIDNFRTLIEAENAAEQARAAS